MTITHNGEVATDADTAADFSTINSGANISADDDFVQGAGGVGDKMSGTNEILATDVLSGGASGVYDFSVSGADENSHIIGWFNTKTPITAVSGIQIHVRNGSGHTGSWYVMPTVFYKGGFITKVINPARDFDTAVTWVVGGNPAQLDDVDTCGGEFDMATTIKGNFNNAQIDQFSIGLGIRAASNRDTFDTQTDVNDSTEVITFTAHGWEDGTPVFYDAESGTADIGLTDLTIYFVNADSVNTVSVHLTRAAAIADTGAINLTDGVSAETHSFTPVYAFEDVRVFDEGLNFFGWWSSTQGAFIGKGKLNLGPASGNAESRFRDEAFTVIFADEFVATGHYEFTLDGTDTLVEWSLESISSANPTQVNQRWDFTCAVTFGDTAGFGFTDTNGVWKQAGIMTLNANCTFTGTTFVDCTSIVQTGATLTSITVLDANTADGVGFVQSDDPSKVKGDFTFSDGHAIEYTGAATDSFAISDLTFTGYGADATTDAAFYNPNTSGTLTLNAQDVTGLTVRTAGGGTTIVNNAVTIRVEGLTPGSAVVIVADETVGTITIGDVLLSGLAGTDGSIQDTGFNYEGAFDPSGLDVIARARNQGIPEAGIAGDNGVFTDETSAANSNAVNTVTLLPTTPVATEDEYYFGHTEQFDSLKLDISTAGTGGFTIVWEYWDGDTWETLSATDGTSSLSVLGVGLVSWTIPGDWATTTINSQGPFYYVRARYTAGTVTVTPLGRKATLNVTKYLPFVQNRIILPTGLTVVASWIPDTISTF